MSHYHAYIHPLPFIQVLLLLRYGANAAIADHEGHSALHWSVFHRHHAVTEWLLKEPPVLAAINTPDSNGKTALHLAAAKSGREMVRKLLEAGADWEAKDLAGECAMEAASKASRAHTSSFLWWYSRAPAPLRKLFYARRQYGRAYSVLPTGEHTYADVC